MNACKGGWRALSTLQPPRAEAWRPPTAADFDFAIGRSGNRPHFVSRGRLLQTSTTWQRSAAPASCGGFRLRLRTKWKSAVPVPRGRLLQTSTTWQLAAAPASYGGFRLRLRTKWKSAALRAPQPTPSAFNHTAAVRGAGELRRISISLAYQVEFGRTSRPVPDSVTPPGRMCTRSCRLGAHLARSPVPRAVASLAAGPLAPPYPPIWRVSGPVPGRMCTLSPRPSAHFARSVTAAPAGDIVVRSIVLAAPHAA